ncbi:hypothetical protein MNBD_GAMMA04-1021, partial [hydrothermal vent metagenome]
MSVLHLSGLALFFSALSLFLFQMLWLRLLGFSESTESATILIAFFSAVILGALLAQWRLRKGDLGLKGFAFSQLIVAVSAVLLLPMLVSPEHIVTLSPSQRIASWDGFLTVFVIALIPAVASGMAFPFLAAWLSRIQPKPSPIGYLYFIFICGALIATLLGGLYILPTFGLKGAIYFAAGYNLIAAFIAYTLLNLVRQNTAIKTSPPEAPLLSKLNSPCTPPIKNGSNPTFLHSLKWLVILGSISFIWMGSEVILSKYISLYAGSTLFSFTIILATSLAGVALGAGLLHYRQTKINLNTNTLFILLIALFIALNITRLLLSYAPQLYNDSHYLGELLNHTDSLWFALMVFLPSVLFGAILSLALSLYCQETRAIQQNFGFAYGLYLLCAMGGAIITVLWLIPTLGSHNTLLILTLTPVL